MLPARLLFSASIPLFLLAAACGGGSAAGTGAGSTTGSGAGTTGTPGTCPVFTPTSPWNTDISGVTIDQKVSDAFMANMNATKHLHPDFGSIYGIPYQYVSGPITKSPVTFDYASESDPGPYPIPANPLVEVLPPGPVTTSCP